MSLSSGFRPVVRLPALIVGLLAVSATPAETVSTVNGEAIDSTVLDIYMQSRTQRAVAQVTPEEREVLLDELTDLYLLSTQDSAAAIEQEPAIQAQIELQTRSLIAQRVAQDYITNLEISEEEIVAEYQEQATMAPPQQYKARHILVESQGEARALITELDAGADFAELAKARSTGPSGPNGGDLGWFSPNQMVAPFSNAVAALKDGNYTTAPVQTDFGWHVILREESRDSEPPPLESVRETIMAALQQKKFQSYLESIRENAE